MAWFATNGRTAFPEMLCRATLWHFSNAKLRMQSQWSWFVMTSQEEFAMLVHATVCSLAYMACRPNLIACNPNAWHWLYLWHRQESFQSADSRLPFFNRKSHYICVWIPKSPEPQPRRVVDCVWCSPIGKVKGLIEYVQLYWNKTEAVDYIFF